MKTLSKLKDGPFAKRGKPLFLLFAIFACARNVRHANSNASQHVARRGKPQDAARSGARRLKAANGLLQQPRTLPVDARLQQPAHEVACAQCGRPTQCSIARPQVRPSPAEHRCRHAFSTPLLARGRPPSMPEMQVTSACHSALLLTHGMQFCERRLCVLIEP